MKMVLVVRADLKMGKGKIAAQVGHAVATIVRVGTEAGDARVRAWFEGNPPQTKVVLRANSELHIAEILAKCPGDVNAVLVRDAGRTQVQPGTLTVLGIGPDDDEKIDAIVSDLKLL